MLTTSCEMDKGLKFGRVMFFSQAEDGIRDRKGTRLNSSHLGISYAVFCLQKKKTRGLHYTEKWQFAYHGQETVHTRTAQRDAERVVSEQVLSHIKRDTMPVVRE